MLIRRSDKTFAERILLDRDQNAGREADRAFRAGYQALFPEYRCHGEECNRAKLKRDGDRLSCRWCGGVWLVGDYEPEPVEAEPAEDERAAKARRARQRASWWKGTVRD